MRDKKALLFYGELPPVAIHGIAYSNMINLKLLENSFEVIIIEERSSLNSDRSFLPKKLFRRLQEHGWIFLKTFQKKVDFFYITFSISFIGGLKTLFSILCFRLSSGGKVILHIHRGDFTMWHDKSAFNKYLASLVVKLSSKIIVLSEIQKAEFEKRFVKPVFVLHNTVECEYSYPARERKNNRFIFISNYLQDKGIIDLLEVFSNLLSVYPDISLYTYGAFPNAEIKDRILSYNNQQIHIGDVITGKEKFAEIERADCLILPSFNEGEPVILLEAMSVGTPVISTSVGSIPELLGNDYPFIYPPGDKASMEEKIIQLLKTPKLLGISQMLKDRYNSFYSNELHALNLNSIFN
jgi:glycosyltransferase involved in cell wall biosynthesis